MRALVVLSLLAGLGLSMGCSRKAPTNTKISIDFGEMSSTSQKTVGGLALTEYKFPQHVIINAHINQNDGIVGNEDSRYLNWSCQIFEDFRKGNLPGMDISLIQQYCRDELAYYPFEFLKMPEGRDALIQVLIVQAVLAVDTTSANGDLSDSMAFYYDDASLIINSGDNVAVIGDTGWQNEGVSDDEGMVAGRIDGGYTGQAFAYYQPTDTTKPPMKVMAETITGGWFSFMFLENVKFTYKLDVDVYGTNNGAVIFSNKKAWRTSTR
ncbi:MAG: hypothetical protein R2827_08645 [Bdellovibrionales bacterium]